MRLCVGLFQFWQFEEAFQPTNPLDSRRFRNEVAVPNTGIGRNSDKTQTGGFAVTGIGQNSDNTETLCFAFTRIGRNSDNTEAGLGYWA